MACNADDLAPCADLLAAARIKGVGNDPRSTRMAAALAVGQGDAARALLEAQRAAKDDPVNQRYAVVETLFALDRIDEARIELGRIASDKSQAAEADRRLGLLDLSSGDLVAAERRFGARLERKEGAGEALYYLAVIAERLGRTDAALRGYQQLIAAGGALTVRTRAAQLLIASGERETATALFDDLLRGNADTVIDVELARANVFAEAGEFDLALAGLDAALQRRPSHPQLLYQRAVTLDAASRTREGVAVLEQMLRDRPDEGTVMNALGYTLADRKLQLSRAEKLIRAALAQRPDNAAFIDSLGWVRYRRNDLKSARTLLTRAYALSRQAEIAAHLGEVLWDIEIEGLPLRPEPRRNCGTCTRCLDLCPTKAFVRERMLDAGRCISYLSIEKRGALQASERNALGEWVFGCDICQEVCPYNAAPLKQHFGASVPELSREAGVGPMLNLADLLSLRSDQAFAKKFQGTALMRAKREGLLRNAAVVAANTMAVSVLPVLIELVGRDPSPVVCRHA
ncbi:MAG: hypothetical protein EBR15_05265, partial [Gammaproteobacteria bacterium]|nr:hypothetical protein [Gammaproteobacteria bacterium]